MATKSTFYIVSARRHCFEAFEWTDVAESDSPPAWNTIPMDRMFVREYFPRIDQRLCYRSILSLKELYKP